MPYETHTLTPQEYTLLTALWNNRGRVMTRAELLDTVWGYPPNTPTRTLDVHIQHLRKKLGLPIQTIFRVGYRLAA